MILVDANILLYAYDEGSTFHSAAKSWWEKSLTEPDPVRLAWSTVLAFIRIGTHPRVFSEPLTVEEAVRHVTEWLNRPMVDTLAPGVRHWDILSRLLRGAQAAGNLATDAHLAALAIEHGATLITTDRDFARFNGLDWKNPLT